MKSIDAILGILERSKRKIDGRWQPTASEHFVNLIERCSPKLKYEAVLGMGTEAFLFVVKHLPLNAKMVIKIPRPHLATQAVERFIRTARTLETLDKDCFPNVKDLNEDPLYCLLSYSDGDTLRDWIWSSRWRFHAGIELFRQVLNAVAILHRDDIVHRDLRIDNILVIPGGRIKVIDFGLAKAITDETLTMAETALGSVGYSPPEQIDDALSATKASDIFTLGRVFYVLAVRAEGVRVKTKIKWKTELLYDAGLTQDAIDFYQKACNFYPEKRFQTGGEMLQALNMLYKPENQTIGEEIDKLKDMFVYCDGHHARTARMAGKKTAQVHRELNAIKARMAKKWLISRY